MLEAVEDRRGREHLDARGGELDGQREPVEPLADLARADRPRPGPRRVAGARAVLEELHGRAELERRHRQLVLAGTRSAARLVATTFTWGAAVSRSRRPARRRATCSKLSMTSSGSRPGERKEVAGSRPRSREPERPQQRGGDAPGRGRRRARRTRRRPRTAGAALRELQRQPGLADPARPREGDQAHAGDRGAARRPARRRPRGRAAAWPARAGGGAARRGGGPGAPSSAGSCAKIAASSSLQLAARDRAPGRRAASRAPAGARRVRPPGARSGTARASSCACRRSRYGCSASSARAPRRARRARPARGRARSAPRARRPAAPRAGPPRSPPPLQRDAGQRRAAEQRRARRAAAPRPPGVAVARACRGAGGERLEALEVELVRLDVHRVAGGARDDRLSRPERAPQLRHVHPEPLVRRGGGSSPQIASMSRSGAHGRAAIGQQEHGQQRPLLRGVEVDIALRAGDAERSEDREVHRSYRRVTTTLPGPRTIPACPPPHHPRHAHDAAGPPSPTGRSGMPGRPAQTRGDMPMRRFRETEEDEMPWRRPEEDGMPRRPRCHSGRMPATDEPDHERPPRAASLVGATPRRRRAWAPRPRAARGGRSRAPRA